MVAITKILLTALLTITVAGQNASPSNTTVVVNTTSANSTTDVPQSALEKCAAEKKCSLSQIECQALCTGVPSPTASQINETNTCVAACDNSNIEQYKVCSQNCINKYYRKVDVPVLAGNNSNSTNSSKNSNSTASSGLLNAASSVSTLVSGCIISFMVVSFYQL